MRNERKQSIDNIKNLDEVTLQYLMSGLLISNKILILCKKP